MLTDLHKISIFGCARLSYASIFLYTQRQLLQFFFVSLPRHNLQAGIHED